MFNKLSKSQKIIRMAKLVAKAKFTAEIRLRGMKIKKTNGMKHLVNKYLNS